MLLACVKNYVSQQLTFQKLDSTSWAHIRPRCPSSPHPI